MSGRQPDAEPPWVLTFPAIGGSSGMFSGLRRAMPDGSRIVVPDLPGRGKRMKVREVPTIPELAAELVTEFEERIAARPYIVFATCFGTMIGLEFLWEARRRGLPMPEMLLVSGRQPPDTGPSYDIYRDWSDADITTDLTAFLHATWPPETGWRDMPASLFDLLLSQLKKDLRMGETYRGRELEPLNVPIRAYYPGELEVTADQMRDWAAHTTVSFELRFIEGGHYFYVVQPEAFAAELAEVGVTA